MNNERPVGVAFADQQALQRAQSGPGRRLVGPLESPSQGPVDDEVRPRAGGDLLIEDGADDSLVLLVRDVVAGLGELGTG